MQPTLHRKNNNFPGTPGPDEATMATGIAPLGRWMGSEGARPFRPVGALRHCQGSRRPADQLE